MSYFNNSYNSGNVNNVVDTSYLNHNQNQEFEQKPPSLQWSWSSIYDTSSQYVGTVTGFLGNTMASLGKTVSSINYTSYPKEHVEPHILPRERTDVCDYLGKSERMVYPMRVLYEGGFGIVHSMEKRYQAQQDCYDFCKRIMAYPISRDFLMTMGYAGMYFGESGGCKNWRIVNDTTTILKDGTIHLPICDGSRTMFINMRTFCGLNKIDYKKLIGHLEIELKNWYQIIDSSA
jgi:hypothetical protein